MMRLCLIALCSLCSVEAFAQAKNFEGFGITVSAEVDHGSSETSHSLAKSHYGSGLGLNLHYNWTADEFLLGAGVTTAPGTRLAGTYATNSSVATKNRYSLDLTPGFAINRDLLLFGKFSYAATSITSDIDSGFTNTKGGNYGLGLRGLIGEKTYWQLGLDTLRFNSASLNSGNMVILRHDLFSMGAGYKF